VTDRSLIVLSLDGLATSALGCYGSSWNSTPAIDTIAGTGCVWDRWIATSDDPQAVLRGMIEVAEWTQDWRVRGSVEMLTDEESLPGDHGNSSFDRIDAITNETPNATDLPASDIVDTQFGQLIAAAIERDFQEEPWSVLWLHSNYLTRRWDAPRDLFHVDEDEEGMIPPSEDVELLEFEPERCEALDRLPSIFDSVIPPQMMLDDQAHPDLVTSWMRTYACQIRLLDLLIEVLLKSLRTEDPYVVLVGTSGLRLGQGGWIGHRQGPLRSADIRVPMVVSDCGPLRVPQPVGSDALPGILKTLGQEERPLLDPQGWCETDAPPIEIQSERAQYAVATSRWFFVQDADSSQHLFLKPDDVEDFNDVSRLRNDVAEQLLQDQKNNPADLPSGRVIDRS
jgi:arylsulfatase A-like enzyme